MVECFNQGLMGHPSRDMEDSSTGDNVDYEVQSGGFSREEYW